jgi:23S rRNA (guanosine2251-2'-O)-methyltransferase
MSTQKFILFGIHAVHSLLTRHPSRVIQLYILEERNDQKFRDILALAKSTGIKVQTVSRQHLDKLTENEVHQGIAAECHKPVAANENDLKQIVSGCAKPFLLILDGIQDPHNLGACLRSADAAGVDAVIVPKDKSVGITPTVSKVASGAAESVPFIAVTNLARTLRDLKEAGVWLFGAAGEAEQSIYQADFTGPLGLVLGAEGQGMRRLTKEHCDVLLNIPMHGSVSSLNVSVATGIFLFEAVRQRQT